MNAAAMFEERIEPGQIASFLMAAVVHLLLVGVLVFGVRWQNSPPESIAVELWEPPPAPVAEAPKPEPKVEPAPPPVVKPEPVIAKPEIVENAPPPKPAPKVEAKPVAKPESLKPKVEETQRRIREELAREQDSLAIDRERQQLALEADAARNRGLAEYEAKIRNKVRGNIVLPPDLQGNPEAHFLVVQLPTGEVLSSKLVKSSGHRGYDDAVERAILKSSPLPKPDRPELFSRELKFKFRPKE